MRSHFLLSSLCILGFSQIAVADGAAPYVELAQSFEQGKRQGKKEVGDALPEREIENTESISLGEIACERLGPQEAVACASMDPKEARKKFFENKPLVYELGKRLSHLEKRVAVADGVRGGTQTPGSENVRIKGGSTVFPYSVDNIYEVFSAPGHLTVVHFEHGEYPLEHSLSDKRFLVRHSESEHQRHHVTIQAQDNGIRGNLYLTTNRRSYYLTLHATDFHMPMIRWSYPKPKRVVKSAPKTKKVSPPKKRQSSHFNPSTLHTRYALSGDTDVAWAPIRVFDDSRWTYIELPLDVKQRSIPSFWALDSGEPAFTNYTFEGNAENFFTIHQIVDNGILRLGDKEIRLRRLQ